MSIQQSKKKSLRAPIDSNCRSCIYDPLAAGNWRQQVTLCRVTTCALYDVRPVSSVPLPERVLEYYRVADSDPEKAI